MLLDPHRRFFVQHHLVFRPHYGHGQPLPFYSDDEYLDVQTVLKQAIASDAAYLHLRNDDVIRLMAVEVRPDNNLAILLFRRSDPNATIQMYEHRPTREIWKANKTDDDAVAISAHLFVNLEKQPSAYYAYHAILEEIPGLGRTYIHGLMSDLLRARTL